MSSDIAKLFVSAATHRGYARKSNEDSFLVDHRIGGGDFDQLTAELMVASHAIVVAIADGLGGHKAGEVASRYAVTQISAKLDEVDFGDDASVSELLNSISRGLHQQMVDAPALMGMGTTIVLAIVTARSLTFINVGDSRGYLIDGSGLRQTTNDDVPPNPFAGQRRTGAITQALGGTSTRSRVIPHVHRTGLPAGDWSIVLCSDGVTDFLSSEEIASIGRSGTADAMTLVDSSLRAGGEDNISAIVVRYSQPQRANGPVDR
ncbi:protein phosphatase 2C domain-containing protein (plasmid) [Sinorhizobium medicae WSM1115]|uniref:PP2C family protein-serine/threonine phosphatase n=1 Tax=Sinorhizobium medicae TaxID=110321 RepID=UPI000382AAA6|nr:protein phosphatase 2C domain-containing protein [Sinorhizobium medicae]UFX06552.1 protein phosphatase 2C domain-containing protein [Sinorhizobium medicae WSM1115]